MSDVLAGRCAIDMSKEQTINKDAKPRGAIIGFSRSLPTYRRLCVTRQQIPVRFRFAGYY